MSKPKPEGVSKYQAFDMERLTRDQITGASYNPRKIDRHARKKLEASLKKFGLVSPITINKRTGTLVAGHQRLAILDDLHEKQGRDYSLDVAVIDVSETQEKALNIQLNNPATQGSYDIDMLGELLRVKDFEVTDTGFDPMDLQLIFEDHELSPMFSEEETPKDATEHIEEVKEIQEANVEEMRQLRRDYKEKMSGKDDAEFYAVIVFDSNDQRVAFMIRVGEDDGARYVDARRVLSHMLEDENPPKAIVTAEGSDDPPQS